VAIDGNQRVHGLRERRTSSRPQEEIVVSKDSQNRASRRKRTSQKPTSPRTGSLAQLGVHGFDAQETVLLAALVTEDPILLIGRSGTGKTFLLNTLSEALGLEHRHYNASLVSFDDLVGFPYPDEEKASVRYLETPATIWNAESVLVDEISRCKPEHQNRFFSLVHERRVQGIALPRLRYRWAAMNPAGSDQGAGDDYTGSEPLDSALADRFSILLEVGDWASLSNDDRKQIANPASEGAIADDGGALAAKIAEWRRRFLEEVPLCPDGIVEYACAATTALGEAGVRISPRRSRLLARTLLAATIVHGSIDEKIFRRVLRVSLPQIAWGAAVKPELVRAAHKVAWACSFLDPKGQWIHRFHLERQLDRKLALLVDQCPDADTGTLAIEQLLAHEPKERQAAFALATFPAAIQGALAIGGEGVADLGRVAEKLLDIDGTIHWAERASQSKTRHPEHSRLGRVLGGLRGTRAARARQLFYWCLIERVVIEDPTQFEQEFHRCVRVAERALKQRDASTAALAQEGAA
jgi:MoxR-like ATPase